MVRARRCVVVGMLLFAIAPLAVRTAAHQTAIATSPTSSPGSSSSGSGQAESGTGAFDIKAAVDAYLAKMPPARRARSDSYFEGGYWLQLWDFLNTVLVMWLMLRLGWSSAMRNLAERMTRLKPLQTAIYWVQFILVVSLLTFPLGLYEGYFREHKYGLLNQSLGPWMRDQLVSLIVGVVLGAILLVPLFGLV